MSQRSTLSRLGFTLIELLVVISIIALLLGILVPVLGVAKKNANIMKEGVNLRNIHAGAVTYGTSNKDWFPGLTSAGKYGITAFSGNYYYAPLNATSTSNSASGALLGATNNYAQAVMMEENVTTPAQWISPGESGTTGSGDKAIAAAIPSPAGTPITTAPSAGGSGFVGAETNSFAVLSYGASDLKAEWKSNQNQQAAVLGSRVIANSGTAFGTSPGTASFSTVWTDSNTGKFKGGVVRGDSSTSTESFTSADCATAFSTLKYGSKVGVVKTASTDTCVGPYGLGTGDNSGGASNFGASATTGTFDGGKIGSINN